MAKYWLSAKELRSLLFYDPDTGIFHWRKPQPRLNNKVNAVAGTVDPIGRIRIKINGNLIFAHRAAFLYMNGRLPKHQVDHKDGNPSNNRWSNLREALPYQNQQNKRKAASASKTGLLGASRDKRTGRYKACIRINGATKHLGVFDDPMEAHKAYVIAKRKHHAFCTI